MKLLDQLKKKFINYEKIFFQLRTLKFEQFKNK